MVSAHQLTAIATADIETVGIFVGSLIRVRLFSCHDCPSHALREINSLGRLSGTVVAPLGLQSKYAVSVSVCFKRIARIVFNK